MKFQSLLVSVLLLTVISLVFPADSQLQAAINSGNLLSVKNESVAGTIDFQTATGLLVFKSCEVLKSDKTRILQVSEEEVDGIRYPYRAIGNATVPLKILLKSHNVLHLIGSIIAPTCDFSP